MSTGKFCKRCGHYPAQCTCVSPDWSETDKVFSVDTSTPQSTPSTNRATIQTAAVIAAIGNRLLVKTREGGHQKEKRSSKRKAQKASRKRNRK